MANKDSTPVRLSRNLFEDARAAGEIEHRTPAKQLEYWVTVGRRVSQFLDPSMLRHILSGTARVIIEPIETPAPDFDTVIAAVETDTQPSRERVGLSPEAPVYQASKEFPGYLERINPDGSVAVGMFKAGEFRVHHPEADATAATR